VCVCGYVRAQPAERKHHTERERRAPRESAVGQREVHAALMTASTPLTPRCRLHESTKLKATLNRIHRDLYRVGSLSLARGAAARAKARCRRECLATSLSSKNSEGAWDWAFWWFWFPTYNALKGKARFETRISGIFNQGIFFNCLYFVRYAQTLCQKYIYWRWKLPILLNLKELIIKIPEI